MEDNIIAPTDAPSSGSLDFQCNQSGKAKREMTSMHVSLRSVTSGNVGNTAGGSRSELEDLQKKMTGLIKELKEAANDQSPGGKERLKLLQLAIQACQMQIERLMNAEAQKAAKKDQLSADSGAASDRKHNTIGLGEQIDTHA